MQILALVAALALSLGLPSIGHASSIAVGSADVHFYSGALSINLAITATQDNCEVPLNGSICLRYAIVSEDTGEPVAAGYGLIPAGDLKASASSITLSTDTSSNQDIECLYGSGGVISLTWKAQPGSTPVTAGTQRATLSDAMVQGTILGYDLPSTGVMASMLMYVGT